MFATNDLLLNVVKKTLKHTKWVHTSYLKINVQLYSIFISAQNELLFCLCFKTAEETDRSAALFTDRNGE